MESKSGRRWATAFCVLLLSAGFSWAARATVVWTSTFEGGDFTKEWNGSLNAKKGTRSNIDVVSDLAEEGKLSCRIVIHPDDTFQPYNQNRVELHHSSKRTAEGEDTYLSGYYRMAADAQVRNEIGYWESDGSSQNVMDYWIEPKTGGGTTINFGTGFLGAMKIWSAAFSLNTWHQLAMHVHWSTNAQLGTVSVWYDGVQVVKEIKAKTKADNNTLFYQTGFHRRTPANFTETIYLDNFVEADALNDVLTTAKPGSDGGAAPSDAGSDASAKDSGPPAPADAAPTTGTGGSGTGGNEGGGAGGSTAATGSGGAGMPTNGSGGAGAGGNPPSASASGGCALTGDAPRTATGGSLTLLLALSALLVRQRRSARP